MDSNPNQACDTVSSHSLNLLTTIGLGILQLRRTKWMKRNDNSQPIDSLPTKFLKIILAKLTWSQLVHLRVVCKRWRAVIHSMGEEKKLLIFNDEQAKIKRSFFGTLDFVNCAHVNLKKVNVYRTSSFETFIVGLFPSVNQLVFNFDEQFPIDMFFKLDLYLLSLKITSLSLKIKFDCNPSKESHNRIANHINLFTSLTQLELCGKFATLLPLIEPTLRRVEHFSYIICQGESDELVSRLVRQFGRNCTRFELYAPDLEFASISQWRTLNPNWLARLTHLQLRAYIFKFNKLAKFLSTNAVSLQVFRFEASPVLTFTPSNNITLTRQAMNDLSRLVHLVELELKCLFFYRDIYFSDPLLNVRSCTLRVNVVNAFSADLFSEILSSILPNVEHLDITILNRSYLNHEISYFQDYLGRFPALRTHKFVVHEQDGSNYYLHHYD